MLWAGLVWARNRDFRSDEAFFRATEAVDPSVPRVHLSLALSYEQQGDGPRAESEFRSSLALWPRYRKARLLYAELLERQSRGPEALAQLRETRELFPADPVVLSRLALAEKEGRKQGTR
jgi:hypothetical protein